MFMSHIYFSIGDPWCWIVLLFSNICCRKVLFLQCLYKKKPFVTFCFNKDVCDLVVCGVDSVA